MPPARGRTAGPATHGAHRATGADSRSGEVRSASCFRPTTGLGKHNFTSATAGMSRSASLEGQGAGMARESRKFICLAPQPTLSLMRVRGCDLGRIVTLFHARVAKLVD